MRPFQHSFLSEERLLTFLASKEKIQNTSRLNFPDVRMTEFTRQIHSLHWTKFFLLFFSAIRCEMNRRWFQEDQMKNPEFCIMPFSLYNDNFLTRRQQEKRRKIHHPKLIEARLNLQSIWQHQKDWKYPCKKAKKKSFIFFLSRNSFPGFLAQKRLEILASQ